MCLSTAYKLTDGVEYKIGEYISNMSINEDEITFSDILGSVTTIVGKLKSIDLEKNIIVIEANS